MHNDKYLSLELTMLDSGLICLDFRLLAICSLQMTLQYVFTLGLACQHQTRALN